MDNKTEIGTVANGSFWWTEINLQKAKPVYLFWSAMQEE
jgi:hypothetical protein